MGSPGFVTHRDITEIEHFRNLHIVECQRCGVSSCQTMGHCSQPTTLACEWANQQMTVTYQGGILAIRDIACTENQTRVMMTLKRESSTSPQNDYP